MNDSTLQIPDAQEEYDSSIDDYYLHQEIPTPIQHSEYRTTMRDSISACKPEPPLHNAETHNAVEDPRASELRTTAKAMYKEANDLYVKTEGHLLAYIKIHSGLRSISDQARLYECYLESLYGGPPAPRANKPGKSYHEYGLAIDIIRGADEDRLKNALSASGWVQAISDEGWHFQAESADDWSDVTQKIENIIKPLSDKYAEDRVVYHENKKRVSEREPGYKKEKKRLDDERITLNKDRSTLNQERTLLLSRQANLNYEDNAIKTERTRVLQLKNSYTGMTYKYCPQNASYEQCTHENLKRQYDSEKNRALFEYQSAVKDLASREQKQATARKTWSDDMILFRANSQRLQERLQSYDQDRTKNEEEGKKINRWKTEMEARDALKLENLNKIISSASKI
ncbi:M15 family metallopeptidase [Pseudomonas putida]|uniref:M15 family metallopeptidase n=1 Tax=Pseudomonas putida TaxID=303 RepID=UPI0015E662A5|nr:M15 family metallopeptidase [Pseudomonas putida]